MGGGDVLDDRQAEPRAAGGAVAGRVDPVEALEDAVDRAGGDADALVDHGDLDATLVGLGGDQDRGVGRGVGHRVGDQVGHRRGDLLLVAQHLQTRGPAGHDVDALVLGVHRAGVHGHAEHVVDVDDGGGVERVVGLQALDARAGIDGG